MQEKLYTISFDKVFDQMITKRDAAGIPKFFYIDGVDVHGEKMKVAFCKSEKGYYAIAGKVWKGNAFKCGRHWHSGRLFYDIYYRKYFRNSSEGNAFYTQVKTTMRIE